MLKRLISYLQLSRDRFRRWLGLKLFDAKVVVKPKVEQPKKIVFLRWDAKWGDAIVSSFVFDEIRRVHPEAKIELVTTPSMSELFKECYGIERVYEINKRPKYSELKSLADVLGDVDVLVHMSPSLKMKDLYFFSKVRAKAIAGLDDEVNLINIKLGQKTKGMHFSGKFDMLLKALRVNDANLQYVVPLNEKSLVRVNRMVDTISPAELIVFNPYGSGNSRRLNIRSIQRVIDSIRKVNTDAHIALLYTPDVREDIEVISAVNHKVIFDADSESIFDAIALVKLADKVISVDTAIVHIASGLGKPTLAIYNPGIENFNAWHPNSDKATAVFALSSSPPDINNMNWAEFSSLTQKFVKGNGVDE